MKMYLVYGHSIALNEACCMETVAQVFETKEEAERYMSGHVSVAHSWMGCGFHSEPDFTEHHTKRNGLFNRYSLTVEYDVRTPEGKEDWLENPMLEHSGIAPCDFNYSEHSRRGFDRVGIKTVCVIDVHIREIEVKVSA